MTWIEKLIAALTGPLVEIVTGLINKWGTKFIIACGSIGAIVYLLISGKVVVEPWIAIAGIAVIAFGYFWFREKADARASGEPPKPEVPIG
jgi:hypothetical protein